MQVTISASVRKIHFPKILDQAPLIKCLSEVIFAILPTLLNTVIDKMAIVLFPNSGKIT